MPPPTCARRAGTGAAARPPCGRGPGTPRPGRGPAPAAAGGPGRGGGGGGAGLASLRARAWYAEARLRAADGRRREACTALRAGLRILDEHRAVLGATDVRAHAAAHRTELVELGLGLALDGGSPRQVLEWVE